MPLRGTDNVHLHGLVDMGSNGIRFSITDLSPPTTRILPTLYTSRVGISLYDAQYSSTGARIPISSDTINEVIDKLIHFKFTCADFMVPEENITVLATEATRTAINSEDFRGRIWKETGWEVQMLAKEDEGRVGALGVATSLGEVKGLVMDLGGGSTQLTWLISDAETGEVRMPERGAVSMPFGAAALSRRLEEAEKKGGGAKKTLAKEIQQAITEAYQSLSIPKELQELAKRQGGYALYLSGGGFRGWGFVLMSKHKVSPYPISLINGFCASRRSFLDTDTVTQAASSHLDSDDDSAIFRISQRRATQVPAVAFLVTALSEALPHITEVRFCQGGVREGYLFSSLSPEIRKQSPVVVATSPFATPGSAHHASLLLSAMPTATLSSTGLSIPLLQAFANLSPHYSSHPKDIRSAAALRAPTTGLLASCHGLSHHERACLSLLLCHRWGGPKDLSATDSPFFFSLQAVIPPQTAWCCKYLGTVAALIGAVYPSGRGDEKMGLTAIWDISKKGEKVMVLKTSDKRGKSLRGIVGEEMEKVEKVGKKKNWIGGKEGVGFKVEVL
ncbi:Ppx-GppA-domain-containing protein [Aureobasidium sp. EXF-3400]|nr:Ppx-GppA-domain-containing protein [Aureobasidium sp. EXF-12344]KAI4779068.1 Ppx-GppA-domain-containing protein [Aureobasidium sp. EXF-3400]